MRSNAARKPGAEAATLVAAAALAGSALGYQAIRFVPWDHPSAPSDPSTAGTLASPLGEEYDVLHALFASSSGEGCFLLFDASLPGAPNDVVTFDGIAEDIRTDVLGTVPTVTEMLTDNGDGTGLTSPGGAALDTPCWFVGAGDALDWEGFDFVTSASMFVTLDGVPVPPAGGGDPIISLSPVAWFDYPDPWDGSFGGIVLTGWAGLSINDVHLSIEVGKVPIKPPFCPADCDDGSQTGTPDGTVNVSDLLLVLASWEVLTLCDVDDGSQTGTPDGVVNVSDLLYVLAEWGDCPTPANDDCTSATVAVDGANPYDTNGATTDGPDETTGCAFAAGDGQIHCDVWFTYTATCDGNLSIDNCGTFTHDSRIAVYDGAAGCPTTGGTPIACSDDAECGVPVGTLQSEILLENISAGSTYLIRVGGFSASDKSNGVLEIDCFIPPDPVRCDLALLLGSLPQVVAADTCTGDPVTAAQACNGVDPASGTGDGTRGKWYRVTGTGNTITIDVEGSIAHPPTFIDTQTLVYCSECDNTCCVTANSATLAGALNYGLSWCSEAGVEYLILVKGDGSSCGIPRLTITDGASCGSPQNCDPPGPANDDCLDAFPISDLSSCIDPNTGLPFSTIGDPAGSPCVAGAPATTDGPLGSGDLACPFGSVPGRDVWYCYTATSDGILYVDTCATGEVDPDFDTVIHLYDGCACPDETSTPIGCDDDGCGVGGGPSAAQAGLSAGQECLIRIGGWFDPALGPASAASGEFCLRVSYEPIRTFPLERGASSLCPGDLDNDGDMDLVATIPGPTVNDAGWIQVLLNPGNDLLGNWLGYTVEPPIAVGREPTDCVVAPLDDDGFDDVAVTNGGDDSVTVKLTAGGGGGGFFPSTVIFPVGDEPSAIASDEYVDDLDARHDLAVAHLGSDDVRVYQNLPPLVEAGASFGLLQVLPLANNADPKDLISDDLDNDKDIDDFDLVTANRGTNDISVFPYVGAVPPAAGPGPFGARIDTTVNAADPVNLAVADLDRDLTLEISTANNGEASASVIENDGAHTYTFDRKVGVGSGPTSIDAAPLNASDVDEDLAVTAVNPPGTPAVQILFHRFPPGAILFLPPQPITVPGTPTIVVAVDVDVDGRPDLVVATAEGPVVVILNKFP
ncbi:MAG: GC-type dockerin domain-anchored protein [Planctomycetota bacterium]|jgi:hypothetical protein